MPHQCVRCNTFYEDGAQEILKGCPCGARLFFYVRKDKLKTAEDVSQKLEPEQKQQIEKDVLNLVGHDEEDKPVVLDFESIRVLQPGKYELDLVQLFQDKPLVFKLEEGKYVIDISEGFSKLKKK